MEEDIDVNERLAQMVSNEFSKTVYYFLKNELPSLSCQMVLSALISFTASLGPKNRNVLENTIEKIFEALEKDPDVDLNELFKKVYDSMNDEAISQMKEE